MIYVNRAICVMLAALGAAVFTACTVKKKEEPHVHEWGEWQYDRDGHWRECTAKDAEQREDHVMENGKCGICGYEGHVHTWSDWQSDESHHWRDCTVGDANESGTHSFKDGRCEVCGYVENSVPGLVFRANDLNTGYIVSSDKSFSLENLQIPATYLGKPVTEIASSAFISKTLLKSVTIPSSIKKIGDNAFSYCTGISSVVIPSSVEEIGGSAFRGCTNLSSVKLNAGLRIIETNAFANCAIKSVTVPEGATRIGVNAFMDCKELSTVVFPSTLTSVASNCLNGTAFYNNSGNWENDVLYIGGYCLFVKKTVGNAPETINVRAGTILLAEAVFNNSSIKNVTLPSGLKYIGNLAFNSAGITSIDIPSSVVSIGENAFTTCKKLQTITGGSSVYTVKNNCIIEKSSKKLIVGCTGSTIPADGSVTTIAKGAFDNMGVSQIILPVGVTVIEEDALGSGYFGVKKIFYLGSPEQFAAVTNGSNAEIYYFSDVEPRKNEDGTAYDGNWWKYGEDNQPEIWTLN